MRIYNQKGMLVIPNSKKRVTNLYDNMVLVKNCYCQHGHNLIGNRVNFNSLNGIYLKARNDEQEGFIGLSPVYGEKCRITWDLDLIEGEILHFFCPTCNADLPVFSPCHCGADIVTFFLNPNADYTDCIGICSRVDCSNAVVRNKGELLSQTIVNSSSKRSGLFQSFLNLDNNGQLFSL